MSFRLPHLSKPMFVPIASFGVDGTALNDVPKWEYRAANVFGPTLLGACHE